MKYIVKVADKSSTPRSGSADKSYEVEIEDIHARPIIARIDGQEFEVNPENGSEPTIQKEAKEFRPFEFSKQPASSRVSTSELTAPLPGTVIEVFVKTGDYIETGHVILVIEAMKMKNSIRSTRAGKVAEVLVSAGETVTHKQVLVRFEQ